MRTKSILLLVLGLSCAACSGDRGSRWKPEGYRDNTTTDLRGGKYEKGKGADQPLPISAPMPGETSSVEDRPVVERPAEVVPAHPEVTPTKAATLAGWLPAPPAGWSAEEASAHEVTTPRGVMTEATRSYWKGPARTSNAVDTRVPQPSIDVTIVDRGQTGADVVEHATVAADERRGVKAKSVTVDGHAGQEFEVSPGFLQLDLDVRSRYLVRVRGGGVSLKDLEEWAAKASKAIR